MTDRVDDLLDERIDGEIESVVWHSETLQTAYGLVVSVLDEPGREMISLSTVILDRDDETLRVHGKNSMWLPAETGVLDGAIRSLARASNATTDAIPEDRDPMVDSLLDPSGDDLMAVEIEDDYDPLDEADDWKASEGVDGIDRVHERLDDAPIQNPDRLIRLEWGQKDPWSGEPQRIMRSPDEIAGNYGVEVDEDDDLIVLDIDDLVDAPLDRLPETLRSESPHDGEHRFYHCPGWREAFRERFSVLNPHPSWGEIRASDGYVVGPGSELTQCKHEDCCTEDDPGQYVLDDAPIATIDAEILVDLLAESREADA